VRAARQAVGLQASGDPVVAFDDFVRRERAALVAFAWALTGSLVIAEEVAQEAISAAWLSWDQVGGYERPGTWARRVVANRSATVRRSAGREVRALTRLAVGRDVDSASVNVEIDLPEDANELWRAVRELPRRQAQTVALFYLEDRSVAEIANILDIAESTVKVHLHKARLSLASSLGLGTKKGDR
jgi:RNA polymerase sigma-70 factor (ECF subfamily)